jgi:hypothetical protein
MSPTKQTLSHLPQWLEFEEISTQAPLQQMSPDGQTTPHAPQLVTS